jgi:hypothetical protein
MNDAAIGRAASAFSPPVPQCSFAESFRSHAASRTEFDDRVSTHYANTTLADLFDQAVVQQGFVWL